MICIWPSLLLHSTNCRRKLAMMCTGSEARGSLKFNKPSWKCHTVLQRYFNGMEATVVPRGKTRMRVRRTRITFW